MLSDLNSSGGGQGVSQFFFSSLGLGICFFIHLDICLSLSVPPTLSLVNSLQVSA